MENVTCTGSIVAVVVTYNRKKLLKECLLALLSQTLNKFNIIIVDNNSSDGTHEYVKEILDDNSNIIYKNTGQNLGGAGGFNFGIKESMKLNPKYIWIMDDDTLPSCAALEELARFANNLNDNFGFLSSKVLWRDGSPCYMNIQRKSISKEINNFDINQKIKLASFVSLFINSDAVLKLGLPLKQFFIWGDDWEYTGRLSSCYDCYYVSNSLVVHNCAENKGVNIVTETKRLDRYFYAYRNEGYFYRKCGFYGINYFFAKVFSHIFKCVFYKTQNKLSKIKIILKGFFASFKFKPKVEYVFPFGEKIDVGIIFGEPLSYGGQEAFMLNMIESFTDKNINYNIFTPFFADNKRFLELKQDNIKITIMDKKFNSFFRKKYIKKTCKNFLKANNFDVVHIQSGSLFVLYYISKIAYKYGVKKVVAHSHCAGTNNLKYKLMKHISDSHILEYVDTFVACSKLAGERKFPKSVIENNQLNIINNGINTSKYTFNDSIRNQYRLSLHLDGYLTLCNIGRFSEQKNQIFLLQICKELKNMGIKFKCLLIGDGELKSLINNSIQQLNLEEDIVLLSKRDDVAKLLMASDIFLLPSLYEGLAVTSIEAQASGLPTICSDRITRETSITDLIHFLPIVNPKVWADFIIEQSKITIDRLKYSDIVNKSGYDSLESAKHLEEIYRGF